MKKDTIFKKVFWYLDKIINDKSKLYNELSQWIYNDDESNHELERQIDRWIKGEQSPSWKYVKCFCSEEFLPSKELFKEVDILTDKVNETVELWIAFQRIFLLAYFINNFFNSLENKQKLITTEQKEYLISGIRYMFRYAWYDNNLQALNIVSENFVFHSLQHTFFSNMPEVGLQGYLENFIPWLIHTNPAVNIGLNKIFETEAEAFID